MRLQLQGLCGRAVRQKGRAAEPVRAGRQGNRPHAQGALCASSTAPAAADGADAARPRRRRAAAPGRSRDNPVVRHASSRAAGSTSRARRRKPGTSSSISPAPASTTRSAIASASFPANDPALVDAVLAALDAPPDFPIGGRTLARGADRRRLAVARARHAVPAHFLSHRRRSAAEGEGARRGRRTRTATPRRSTCWRPCRSFAGIRPDPGSLHRSARSVAAARLFDLVVAQNAIPAASRSRSMRCATRSTSAPASASPRPSSRPRRARRQDQGLCAEGAAFRAAGRSEQADHHDRAWHRRRAVPRIPAGAAGDQGAGPQLAVISAISAATTISSTRTSSRRCARRAISRA